MGKIEELDKLNIKEKISLTYGANFWQTSYIKKTFTDGPHGIRLQKESLGYDHIDLSDSYKAINYPSLSSLANSFNPQLIENVGYQIGLEGNKLGVDMVLAPGINIIRHPRCGRAFEYFSEDPIVSGTLGEAYIKGVEKSGASCCVKHFIANNQEYKRMLTNSVLDSRTLHELYLESFKIALKAKPSAIMLSYNMVNGTYMCQNKKAIDYLRNNLNYKGLVMSDWGAVGDSAKALKAGLNLEMPGADSSHNDYILDLINQGKISEDDININAKYVLNYLKKDKKKISFDEKKAINIALKAAEDSIVLLKNDQILPLKKKDNILVIGKFFVNSRLGGSGSSEVNPSVLVEPKEAFDNLNVKYDYIETFDNSGNITNLDECLEKVSSYDKVLIFTGLPRDKESEGYDRETLDLPKNYLDVIKKVSNKNSNVVVIINAGSVTNVSYKNDVKGIIHMGLLGSLGGKAICNILYGKANPSARLAQSFIKEEDTYLSKKYPSKDTNIKYSEGLYVGYPYYYINNIKPIFSFGHGLSYGKQEHVVIDLDKSFDIKISTDIKMKDTLFLFVEDDDHYIRLKDYKKVELKKGETKIINFKISDDYFKFYKDSKLVDGSGKFKIHIGLSLDNILYTKEIIIAGKNKYIHPLFDLKLNDNLFKKSRKANLFSTLYDLRNNKYYPLLLERLNIGSNIDSETNLMVKRQKEAAINENPLHFYMLFKELNISIYELNELIKRINCKN